MSTVVRVQLAIMLTVAPLALEFFCQGPGWQTARLQFHPLWYQIVARSSSRAQHIIPVTCYQKAKPTSTDPASHQHQPLSNWDPRLCGWCFQGSSIVRFKISFSLPVTLLREPSLYRRHSVGQKEHNYLINCPLKRCTLRKQSSTRWCFLCYKL